VVDQSLLRRAADRGVTICFADLDGAEGLWVPEERTVLVNRGLSEAKAAEVIEHELAHVMIDDQHADLDAGKDVLSGHPPTRSWRSETVALAAAVGLIAVVGGAVYGINATRGDVKREQVAPNNGPGLTATESADPRNLPPNVIRSRAPDGRIVYVTLTPTPGAPTPTASATPSPTASATATKPPAQVPPSTVPVPTPTTSSSAPPAPPTTGPPPTTPTPDPTTPPPTSPVAPTAGAGDTGDQGGAGGSAPAPGPTEPATVASIASDFPPADGTVESPADSPAGGALDGAPDSTTGG